MVNYSNGKVYKIEPVCEHQEGEIYIGSTTKKLLCQRMTAHRKDYKMWKNETNNVGKVMAYELFDKYGLDNCKIILLEEVNATSKDELLSKEAYYIRNLKCVNKYIPLRTQKEYYNDNIIKIKQNRKDYSNKNAEIIRQKRKI